MNQREVGKCWNENADAWTQLARAGYDVYRDYLNTPAFLAMLPDVQKLRGIDIGCGEGHNTRRMAQRGAHLVGIDIAERFIGHAAEAERKESLGIKYCVASALEIPFPDEHFDFATAVMSLMDMPNLEHALTEIFRVIKSGGFLQFSISHPCFSTPHRRNLRNAQGQTYAIEVGDYFRNLDGNVEEWIFGAAPEDLKQKHAKFKTPRFTQTVSQWLNLLIRTGFTIEQVEEPEPSDETVGECPDMQDAQVVAYFLHVRVRKPAVDMHLRGKTARKIKRTSKFLSLILRHRPEKIGLTLDSRGWADVDELLQCAARHGRVISHDHLRQVVRENDKQRFSFDDEGRRIRANQGHSIPINLGLEQREPPEKLFHGTATRFVESIREHGLVSGSRQHVHLSPDRETAAKVGRRHGEPVILTILASQMAGNGHTFYLSENGVWLTGAVPSRYIVWDPVNPEFGLERNHTR